MRYETSLNSSSSSSRCGSRLKMVIKLKRGSDNGQVWSRFRLSNTTKQSVLSRHYTVNVLLVCITYFRRLTASNPKWHRSTGQLTSAVDIRLVVPNTLPTQCKLNGIVSNILVQCT